MSHTHEGTPFTEGVEMAFEADAEPDVGGTVVIRVPQQNPDSLVRGVRFIKTPWASGKVPSPDPNIYPVIHFEVEVDAGADQDGTVPFDPPITLQVPYDNVSAAGVDWRRLRLRFLDDESGKWLTFGEDEIFGHRQTIQVLEEPKIAIVFGIRRWADPHVGWHAV